MLLNSSSAKGSCYIETKNLDGETNLKYKCAIEETVDFSGTGGDEEILSNFSVGGIIVECDGPNEALYSF